MEEHRLKPMPSGYDQKLFKDIYKKTKDLRNRLTSQIDHTRFGVERDDVKSWFDVKFIFVFNKYYGQKPEILKAHIIQALQFFKNRILRYSYSQKNSVNLFSEDIEESYYRKETQIDPQYNEDSLYLKTAIEFLKTKISKDAIQVLRVELSPPPFILKRLSEKENTTKIPNKLISEYLGFTESYTYQLKKEIRQGIQVAQLHFRSRNTPQ